MAMNVPAPGGDIVVKLGDAIDDGHQGLRDGLAGSIARTPRHRELRGRHWPAWGKRSSGADHAAAFGEAGQISKTRCEIKGCPSLSD